MHATPDTAALLKPLADFYTGRALPEVRFIEAARMPLALSPTAGSSRMI